MTKRTITDLTTDRTEKKVCVENPTLKINMKIPYLDVSIHGKADATPDKSLVTDFRSGRLICQNKCYSGTFVNGRLEQHGKITYYNNFNDASLDRNPVKTYEGDFRNGQLINGFKIVYPLGLITETGRFENEQLTKGHRHSNSCEEEGQFENGRLVEGKRTTANTIVEGKFGHAGEFEGTYKTKMHQQNQTYVFRAKIKQVKTNEQLILLKCQVRYDGPLYLLDNTALRYYCCRSLDDHTVRELNQCFNETIINPFRPEMLREQIERMYSRGMMDRYWYDYHQILIRNLNTPAKDF